jgi:hypothetical protein
MITDVHTGPRILIFHQSRIPDPGAKKHRTPDPDPQHCCNIHFSMRITTSESGSGPSKKNRNIA